MTSGRFVKPLYRSPIEIWGSALVGVVLVGLVAYVRWKFPSRPDGWQVDAVFLSLALVSFLGAYALARSKTLLYDDRVEWYGAFLPTLRLFAHDVAGFRHTSSGRLRLIPKGKGRTIAIPPDALEAGVAWLERLPDLDAAEREALRKRALANPRFGSTPAKRKAFIERLPRRLRWLNAIGWFGGLWAMFWPHPYAAALALMFAAPLIALGVMIWTRPLVNVDEERDKPGEISILGLYFVPSMAFAFRSLIDLNVLEWIAPLLAALVGGLAVTRLIAWCDPPLRWRTGGLAEVIFISIAYALGATQHANVLLDTAQSQRFETVVVEKPDPDRNITNLIVGAWGQNKAENTVRAHGDVFESAKPGDRVCIDVHPGAFGWRWYDVNACSG